AARAARTTESHAAVRVQWTWPPVAWARRSRATNSPRSAVRSSRSSNSQASRRLATWSHGSRPSSPAARKALSIIASVRSVIGSVITAHSSRPCQRMGPRRGAPLQSPTMELLLVRHGEPEWVRDGFNVDDPPLTTRGHEQAERLAGRLAAEYFDEIY